MRKFIFILSVFLGAFAIFIPTSKILPWGPAHANAADTEKDAACSFQTQLDAIKNAAEDRNLDSAQRVKAELSARKSMLKNIIDCAARDVENLKNETATTAAPQEGPVQQIKGQIIGDLGASLRYYATQKAQIENVGTRGSQELARDIKEWRTISYNPLAQKAVNFIAWSKNKELIQTAQNRLNQVRRTVTVLKLLNDEEFQKLFARADIHFNEAISSNYKTLETFTRLGNPEDALISIKATLEALSQTYQEFFTISERINKLLPSK